MDILNPTADLETPPSAQRVSRAGKKEYRCRECSRTFTTSGHLSRHTRVHTGERNHVCPFPDCNKSCSRQDNLLQHYRMHLPKSEHPYATTEVRQALEDMFRQQGIERTSAPPPPARPSPPSRSPKSPPAPKVQAPPPPPPVRPQSYPSPPPHLPPPPMQHPLPPPPPGMYPPGFMIHGSPTYDPHDPRLQSQDRLSPASPSSPAHSDSPSTPEFPIDPQLLQSHPKPVGTSNPQTPSSPPPVTMSPFGPPQRRGYEVSYMRGEH